MSSLTTKAVYTNNTIYFEIITVLEGKFGK